MSDLLLSLFLAFIGGLLPALIWLWFWLKQDDSHPEPNSLIIKTFFLGMGMVPVAFVFQGIINFVFLGGDGDLIVQRGDILTIAVILIYAFIEEFVKFVAARSGGLLSKSNDEPVDIPIYMITAALGFAALENMLFLLIPIIEHELGTAFISGNLRFIGATLLHVSSSAIIGIFGSLAYFLREKIKKIYLFIGFVLATLLHSIFNLFIISHNDLAYFGFITVWIFVVIIIILFERIKKIKASSPR